jgi:polyferredoxin
MEEAEEEEIMVKVSGLKFRPIRNKWAFARKTVQIVILGLFLVVVIGIHSLAWPNEISDLPFRLDPLAMLTQSIAARTVLAGSALAVLTILLTLAVGRAWCGWICPLGTTLDLIPLKKKGRPGAVQPVPEYWRKIKYLLLIASLVAALFTNLTLLALDPITILFRSLTTAILPALNTAAGAVEAALGPIPILQEPIAIIDSAIRPSILPLTPSVYAYALLYGAFLLAIIGLNRVAHRFWCRYLCPLGGLLGWISKFALVRRQVTGDCKDCQLCARECPVATIRPDQGYASDPSECTVCMDCLGACRLDGNTFRFTAKPSSWSDYDPSRREALQTFGLAAAAIALGRTEPAPERAAPHYIQPPGGRENGMLSKCIRCGECIRVCPTSGLQPAWFEAGLDGIWTPILVPRLGYCDYSCNACGQICPVQAIPPLPLDEKRVAVIGAAYIDENRCIAWSDHQNCTVCEEMCPLPQKAIYLLPQSFLDAQGNSSDVNLPYVNRGLCIGCGICETKCPVRGEAAIRVYTPGSPVSG